AVRENFAGREKRPDGWGAEGGSPLASDPLLTWGRTWPPKSGSVLCPVVSRKPDESPRNPIDPKKSGGGGVRRRSGSSAGPGQKLKPAPAEKPPWPRASIVAPTLATPRPSLKVDDAPRAKAVSPR